MSMIKMKLCDGPQISPKSSSFVFGQLKAPTFLKIPNLFVQSERNLRNIGQRQGSELPVKQSISNKASTLDTEPRNGYFKFLEKYLTQTERFQQICPKVRRRIQLSPQSKVVLSSNNVQFTSPLSEQQAELFPAKAKQFTSSESQCIEEFFPLSPVSTKQQKLEKKQKYYQPQLRFTQGQSSKRDFNQLYQSLMEQQQRQLQQEITLISKNKSKLTPLSKIIGNPRQKTKFTSTPRVMRYISFD